MTETNTKKRKTFMVIDGHAMIHRAFHALPEELTTSKGEVVNATYGFTMLLLKAISEFKPDYIAVAFDRSAPTFRHIEFPEYKAHRPTLPDNMRPQFGRIREIVEAFGIPIYEKDGFEADDVIGALTQQATTMGLNSLILTGDTDTFQLIDDHVSVILARQGITETSKYGLAQVEARYGLPPEKLPDFKGLVGDKSDNIPGVPGVGEKTATKLLARYGSIEGILEHLDELSPRDQRLLRGKEDIALQSKHLATIVCNVPVQLDLEKTKAGQLNRQQIIALFRDLEFLSLVDRLPKEDGEEPTKETTPPSKKKPEPPPPQDEELLETPPVGIVPIIAPPPPPGISSVSMPATQSAALQTEERQTAVGVIEAGSQEDEISQPSLFGDLGPVKEEVRKLRLPSPTQSRQQDEINMLFLEEKDAHKTNTLIVNTEEALRILVKSLRDAGAFALDTESTSEDPWHAELVGISCSMAPGEAYYIPVGHIDTVDGQKAGPQLSWQQVKEKLGPVLEDERIQKYMHNAKYDMLLLLRSGVAMKGLAFDTMLGAYLVDPGRRGLGLKEQALLRLGIQMTPISELIGTGSKMISMAQVPVRLAADYAGADADMTLRLVEPVREDLRRHGLLDLYYRIELPLLPVLMQMELYGVALDGDFLRELDVRLSEQIQTLEQEIYASVGHQFNINSTRQLGEILFNELKLPAGKKNKTGYSVSADVIEGLRGRHPVIDYLLEYRQLAKLKSTYIDGLLALMDPVTGRVHTTFSQTTASSGRLSSSNPNLQNIPVRTEIGRQIRRAFIADPSYVLLTADYSQFELRILSHITHEPRLVEAFNKDEDIHTITASSLFNVPPPEVTKDQRRLAKTVVYAVLYGQSAFGLAQITGMSNSEAAEFIKRYHETFPKIKQYVDSTLGQAYRQGYVNTLYGRKRFFPNMHSAPHNERQALEREAINMPIQGTNADLIKIAMVRIQHQIEQKQMKTRMILQVHDELVFEVPVEELDKARYLVKREMEQVAKLDVPIKVEMKVGKNWYEAETMV
ncbi:MAG TPA: DNA polymerase I [Ktedonobacteraceae bacterium]|jgi:DNA polymerase-1|nr:DNA polymerase I [Ktedonobacteraceae bacterium]